MLIRRSIGEKIFDKLNAAFMAALIVLTLYPLLYVLFASLSDPTKMMAHRGVLLYPKGFSLEAYVMVFQNPMIVKGYENTLIYVIGGLILNLVLTSLGAYVLSRKNVYFKNHIMFLITFTMFFNGGLIPTYLLINDLNMLDTRWSIVLPSAISAWNLIIMRTSFEAIPVSMEESAKMDGANDLTVLFKIIVPLSMPVISVMILFYGVGHWNAWFKAMIYLRDRELYPLQLILREILIVNSTDSMVTNVGTDDKQFVSETLKYATIIIATVPILFIYPFLQKYFVKGVMIGAIKE